MMILSHCIVLCLKLCPLLLCLRCWTVSETTLCFLVLFMNFFIHYFVHTLIFFKFLLSSLLSCKLKFQKLMTFINLDHCSHICAIKELLHTVHFSVTVLLYYHQSRKRIPCKIFLTYVRLKQVFRLILRETCDSQDFELYLVSIGEIC